MRARSMTPKGEKEASCVLKALICLAVFIMVCLSITTERLAAAYARKGPLRNCTCPPVVATVDFILVSPVGDDAHRLATQSGASPYPTFQPLGPVMSSADSPSGAPRTSTPLTVPTADGTASTSSHSLHPTHQSLQVETVVRPRLGRLKGPLCVFVPNTDGVELLNEAGAAMLNWFDNSTLLYTSSNTTAAALRELAIETDSAIAIDRWQSQRSAVRGAPSSIILFQWISELVKRNDPLVQNCKWFMKCDTDTYLRRGLLEREVLNKLDHKKPYHVGVPLKFTTRPYHHTLRPIEFDYNIGGPGYTFSRGLMASVDTFECIGSMSMDPVLLIHDDVATGYCATYHAPQSERLDVTGYVAASAHRVVSYLLSPIPPTNAATNLTASSPLLDHVALLLARQRKRRELRGFSIRYQAQDDHSPRSDTPANMSPYFNFVPPTSIRNDTDCIADVFALHPVTADMTRLLAQRDRERRVTVSPGEKCTVKLMSGQPIIVGSGWILHEPLALMTKFWVQLWDRRRYQTFNGPGFRYAGEVLDVLMKG